MYEVYVLQSIKDKRTYIGYTNNFERRLSEHNSGKSKSTKYRAPFKLLFKEQYISVKDAKNREKWWKSNIGRKKLKEYFRAHSSIG